MNKFHLSDIYVYPIKSLGGIRLEEARIEDKGLQYDRRWMLIDEAGTFITQRKHPTLALLQVDIVDTTLVVSNRLFPEERIVFPINGNTGLSQPVVIWDDVSTGFEVDENVSQWFSDFMKMKVKLVGMPKEEKRKVDPRYAVQHEIVSFADGYPCLIIGQSSLDGLNVKLEEPVLMDRFRPNFVFTGGEPHVEDRFRTFELSGISFSAVKPCARCVLITVDQQTGVKGAEPLRTLAGYRSINKKILFGQNLLHEGEGMIRVGDELKVKTWK
ncbi:MOSC domain-containing protein [Pedobacter sp. GR22-6]|uniref:MOSC domain-containing protein n=1 Tax=Pedobacter sp. GR22-6 TaxID=3127957 RepID=UPI00307E0278